MLSGGGQKIISRRRVDKWLEMEEVDHTPVARHCAHSRPAAEISQSRSLPARAVMTSPAGQQLVHPAANNSEESRGLGTEFLRSRRASAELMEPNNRLAIISFVPATC